MSTGPELLDVLAEDGRVVGRKPRHLVHRGPRPARARLRVVRLRRGRAAGDGPAATRTPRGPLRWPDRRPGGRHILAGETAVDAGRRELLEEVGLTAAAGDLLYLGSSRKERPTGDCRRILQHLLLYPVPLDLSRLRFSDEVDGLAEVDLEEFSELVLGRRASLRGRVRFAGKGEGDRRAGAAEARR